MAGTAKQGFLSIKLGSKEELYDSYMSFLRGGGMFVPTTAPYSLGDEVVLLISLTETKDRFSVAGRVAWVTPPHAGNRRPGVGVHFNETAGDGDAARTKIEAILGGMLNADRPTQTM